MRTLVVLLTLVCAAPASASELLVVGRTKTLSGPRAVKAGADHVKVGGRRCAVAARTPLAALLDARLKLSLRDYGACGRQAAAASGLYVRGVAGEQENGRRRLGLQARAPDAVQRSGRPGVAHARPGAVVLVPAGQTGCQRTLDTMTLADVGAAGEVLDVQVRAYDDQGKGIPAAGATVSVGDSASAVADADGVAHVTLGPETGTLDVVATAPRWVRSFPDPVEVQ